MTKLKLEESCLPVCFSYRLKSKKSSVFSVRSAMMTTAYTAIAVSSIRMLQPQEMRVECHCRIMVTEASAVVVDEERSRCLASLEAELGREV